MEEVKTILITDKRIDEDGHKYYNEYKALRKYGEGSVGKVREVLNTKTNTKFAMKVVNKLLLQMRKEYVRIGKGKMGIKTAFDAVDKEISIMHGLDHENIVKLHEILTDEDNEKLYIILDDCDNGETMTWDADTMSFKPCSGQDHFTEEEIRRIIIDTIHGLQYLHDKGIIHRDIKPQNLLMTKEGKTKIWDFGVAIKVEGRDNDIVKSTEGTYHFMPPEWWNYEVREFSGVKIDTWALGVTLFAFTYNKMPFWADSEIELGNVIMTDEPDFVHQDRDTSKDLKMLIMKLLQKDPTKRPNLADLLTNDEFLTKTE